jgi:hypothetical protein
LKEDYNMPDVYATITEIEPETQERLVDVLMTQEIVTKIANLLSQAGSAHHHFEQTVLKGVYDQEWPAWYARYVIAYGLEELLSTTVPVEQLSQFLAENYELYKRENSPLGWADYTARQINKNFRNTENAEEAQRLTGN